MGTRVRAIGILVALAVLLTSAQCVMACAVARCQTQKDIPPCHRQHSGQSDKVPLACSHDLAIGRAAHLNTQISNCDFSNPASATIVVLPAPIVDAGYGVTRQSPSPPDLACLSAVVLRI
jgi:hypothetical protein